MQNYFSIKIKNNYFYFGLKLDMMYTRAKKILKIIGFSLLSVICLVVVYLLAAYILSRIGVDRETADAQDVPIYILSNGVHTDLVMPIKNNVVDWSNDIGFKNTVSQDSLMTYVAIGWGDKGFYLETPTWADLKFKTAFKASFGLSHSAIHATFYKSINENEYCKRLMLSRDQYSRLVTYIKSNFETDSLGHTIPIKTNANYGGNDAFYEARGRYHLFRTCNTWTNSGLKSCGQKACLWTPFDKGILYQYREKK